MKKKRNIINLNKKNIQNETFEKETNLINNHNKIPSSHVFKAFPETKFNMKLIENINISRNSNFNTSKTTNSNIT